MTEEQKDRFFDLLAMKAVYGLDEEAQRELNEFDPQLTEQELLSFERTAAAISMIGLEEDKLPSHIFAKIADNAEAYIGSTTPAESASPWPPPEKTDKNVEESSGSPWFGWLGWAVAAAACIALAVNVFIMRPEGPEVAQIGQTPVETPRVLSPAEKRDELLRSDSDIVRGNWALGNVKELKEISGDVVWSDEKQAGYMRFRGLPPNDPGKETYQLWIFDKTQDKATPIDGGTFDVSSEGEVVIPINAKLKAEGPEMFAITIEKPGGVVVSSREKIAALAKVETQPS